MNKLLFFFIFLFTLVNIADAITFLYILPGESNPVYIFTQSPLLMIFLKFLLVAGMWVIFNNLHKLKSDAAKYAYILCIILGIYTVGLGVYSNVQGILNPNLVEQIAKTSTEEKLAYYRQFILLIYAMPYILGFISFLVWKNITKKEEIKVG